VTARQQIARLLPLVLLVVLVVVGLHGIVTAPRWDGPLRSQGVAIGIAVEVVFGALLLAVRSRAAAARRQREAQPYNPNAADQDIEPAQALRVVLQFLLPACMVAVAVVVLVNLHLHFFSGKATKPVAPATALPKLPTSSPRPSSGVSLHVPVGPILYGLLIALIVVAVVVSVWWSTRLRRPAATPVITDVTTEDLRQAVDEGRAALAAIDDARAAIIACYLAMEARLADRGTARAAADTPDELLARAVAAGSVRGRAASRLTALFYEARFSTHPQAAGQRDAASAALDELAAELAPPKTDTARTDEADTDTDKAPA